MRFILPVLVLGLTLASASAQERLPAATVNAVKQATVFIMNANAAGQGVSGSGFLIRADGQAGFVVTNKHVISPRKGVAGPTRITVVIACGTPAERAVPAQVIAKSAHSDLAILKISGVPEIPAPIDIRKESELIETMPVFVFGFPFGEDLALARESPSVVVGRGSISSIRRSRDGRILAVLIDGALNPGNSGGPIVDAEGRLVAIAAATIPGAHIGAGVPRADLVAMLTGLPETLYVKTAASRNGSHELMIELPLLDPFESVRRVKLLYKIAKAEQIKTQAVAADNSPEPITGATELQLELDARMAKGTVTLPAAPGTDADLTYQVAIHHATGPAVFTRPNHFFFSAPRASSAEKPGPIRLWGEAMDPDGDCKFTFGDGNLSLRVPGTLHDLSTEVGKVYAPRILQEVGGDFIAKVKVCGRFQPTEPVTRRGGVPFNGAGLLVWLDAGRFMRVERAAVTRNGSTSPYFLVEHHELNALGDSSGSLPNGDVYLKVERKGRRATAYYSDDGQHWIMAKPTQIDWPARLKVGVAAISSSASPLSVRFEQFSVLPWTSESSGTNTDKRGR